MAPCHLPRLLLLAITILPSVIAEQCVTDLPPSGACSLIHSLPANCRCSYSSTCDDSEGIYSPCAYFTYCAFGGNSWFGIMLLFPPLLLYLALQFSVLGSTAEDFFSPSLEMFSTTLHLPPRFAGVTLLALGNGAPDVSSTISAINSTADGYKLSLGALTGAGMFVTCAVSSIVILIADGVKCRGALIRDIVSLFLALLLVTLGIGVRGIVDTGIIAAFVAFYIAFILTVLAADVYHRKVTLPRLRSLATAGLGGGARSTTANGGDDQSNFGRMLEAFSNYDNSGRESGWVQEDDDGFVSLSSMKTKKKKRQNNNDDHDEETVDYSLMESFEIDDTNVGGGATQPPAATPLSLKEGFADVKLQLREAFSLYVEETFKDGEVPVYTRVYAIFEAPYLFARCVSVCLTSPDEYSQGMLTLSTAFSPVWLALYAHTSHDINMFSSGAYWIIQPFALAVALAVVRFCPPTGAPPLVFQVPLALYGFVVAATWIDFVADQLVSILSYLGIIMNIPAAVLGLTVLAWGNSIGDLSTNMSMAKRGLSNMSITACFAGPIFNFLIGLGAGFHVQLGAAGATSMKVTFDKSVWCGLIIMMINCVGVLVVGLKNGGEVPKQYGYLGIGLYVVYLGASLVLQL